VRLAYAQHISKQQGATVTHAFALTGGWQTSRETTYVQATRPRDGCEWFIAREDLGSAGQDEQRIHELANRMRDSRREIPSIAYHHTPEPDIGLGPEIEHTRLLPRLLARITQPDQDRDFDPHITR
jgi:hypothetical protein